jgi:hypothetical protein
MTTPERLLQETEEKYPNAWKTVRRLLAGREELGGWPDWCYMPMAGAYAIASGGGALPPGRQQDISILAALAAWRPTKAIVEVDEAILRSLLEQPMPEALDAGALTDLPVWCLYVDLSALEEAPAGVFLHLEHDANDGHAEFRGLIVGEAVGGEALTTEPVLLDLGDTPEEGARSVLQEAVRVAQQTGHTIPIEMGTTDALAERARPFLSLAQYLASPLAEWNPSAPQRPRRRPDLAASQVQRFTVQ